MITLRKIKLAGAALAFLISAAVGGQALAVDEITVTYTDLDETFNPVDRSYDSGEDIPISRPWPSGNYQARIRASSSGLRKTADVGVITVDDPPGITCNLMFQYNINLFTLGSYAFDNLGGIHLASAQDSHLFVWGWIYGDLTGDIKNTNDSQAIRAIDLECAGTIKEDVTIEAFEIEALRAHIIEGGVTIKSFFRSGAKIGNIRTGYSKNERISVNGTWPTKGEMDIGTSANPVKLITEANVNLDGSIISMDDLYLDLDIGGKTTLLRNALSTSEIGNFDDYTVGTLTHRMQLTGQTVTLGNIYASADNGGYLDTATGTLNITSSTADYAGNIESILGGSGANEVDFRGRLWFNAGIAAAAQIRLEDAMDGELIFNAVNNDRSWHPSSLVVINGINITDESPAYSLTTSGGGTVGMVDGVGNNLGFHLHLEAADPATSAAISRAAWLAGTVSINLTFYGPVRLNGLNFHVDLQRWDDISGQWVAGAICNLPPVDALDYELIPSGTNTSLNVVKLTLCSTCGCTLPLGNYRIIERPGGLKSDLGLAQDPDVQPFDYRFTLTQ